MIDLSEKEFELLPEPPPLRWEKGGVIRLGGGRISLDLIVELYENGSTPDDMVRDYDTLELADVYGAIAYYLQHREEVQAYMNRREEEAKKLRAIIESERPRITREELLSRRKQQESDHAAACK